MLLSCVIFSGSVDNPWFKTVIGDRSNNKKNLDNKVRKIIKLEHNLKYTINIYVVPTLHCCSCCCIVMLCKLLSIHVTEML